MTYHIELREALEERYGDGTLEAVELKQDALLAHLDNGVALEIRYANPQEYSIAWLWGEAQLRIDTAPLHRQLATFPNHLHDAEGGVVADPLTVPGAAPWENVQRVVDALIANPLLTVS